VVDDDVRIRTLLGDWLKQNGFDVTLADGPEMARLRLHQMAHHLMVLDVMMPGHNGVDFLKSLRAAPPPVSRIPVIFLTARGDTEHRLEGLTSGADDYLAKPFDPRELALRIRAVLGRQGSIHPAVTCWGPWRFAHQGKRLFRAETPVHLTTSEIFLLERLCLGAGQTVTREELLAPGTPGADPEAATRAVDVGINRLRRKIEEDPACPRWIQTVRHRGYRLCLS
jgi:two-component system phosphate regulon response regulator OmpR